VFLHSFLFFRCLFVHDGSKLRTIEIPADLSRLRLVSQSLSSYGGGAARAAVPGGPLAAPPPDFRPGAGEAAPCPPLGGVDGGWRLFPSFGAGRDRPAGRRPNVCSCACSSWRRRRRCSLSRRSRTRTCSQTTETRSRTRRLS